MRCREFEAQICDYLDDALNADARREMDEHRLSCPICAEAFEEIEAGLGLLKRAPLVEPPPQLIADIIHDTVGISTVRHVEEDAPEFWQSLLHPLLQPRLAMSMAVMALSFSMLTVQGDRLLKNMQDGKSAETVGVVELVRDTFVDLWNETRDVYEAARQYYLLQMEYADRPTRELEPEPAREESSKTPASPPDEPRQEGN